MPDRPSISNFATDGSEDTAVTLTTGASEVSTVLTSDLSEEEEKVAFVDDATGSVRKQGVMRIEEEIIYYGIFDPSSPNHLYDLIRGQEGTTPAPHLTGATVTIFGAAKFHNPARTQALISTQSELISMKVLIDDLTSRIEALEAE